ncbi:MAG: 16S rRNA (guanine(527)-N(7))-methyltransferase RsmG [Fimbriimonadaceae bacterium]|nr:16S rRNA (guanine(527)-N(7))-methyltransferase RsmG [Fimbriimonadaceae bacterium]
MDSESLRQGAAQIGLNLDPETLIAFEGFERDLYEANSVMNLTRVPREECVVRHFLDSLLIAPEAESGATVLDLGTGPGFPAWPLALARPDLRVTALDSSGKMLGFLRRHPLPNLEIVEARAEDWGARERFDLVTGRALAPLAIQLELSAPPCRVGGTVCPMRTPNDLAAIAAFPAARLGLASPEIVERRLPHSDIVRVLPRFPKVRATDRAYPRRWAEIRARQLA